VVIVLLSTVEVLPWSLKWEEKMLSRKLRSHPRVDYLYTLMMHLLGSKRDPEWGFQDKNSLLYLVDIPLNSLVRINQDLRLDGLRTLIFSITLTSKNYS
jgi:hypothetical protein